MNPENLSFHQAVAQLLPLMLITALVEQGFASRPNDQGDSVNSDPRLWFRRALSSALTLATIGTIVAAEAVALRILYTGRATQRSRLLLFGLYSLRGSASSRRLY
jgi:hypothetical protein